MRIQSIVLWAALSAAVGGAFLWLANRSMSGTVEQAEELPEAKETIVLPPSEPGETIAVGREIELTEVEPAELGAGPASAPPILVTTADPGALTAAIEESAPLQFSDQSPDWDASIEHPKMDPNRLNTQQLEAVRLAPMPVLLPDDQALLESAQFSTGDFFYAASMAQDEHQVVVSANNRVIASLAETPEPPNYGDHERSITREEGIVTMSFKAFGTYYSVDVECFRPGSDPRCTQDSYVLEIADGLLHAAVR